jgi:hypothetical protein
MYILDMARFNLKKLNDAEIREQCQFEISDRFAALENLDDNMEIKRAWEGIGENIKTSSIGGLDHYKLKQHKPWPQN